MIGCNIYRRIFSLLARLTNCFFPSVLQENRHKLTGDIQNKTDALDIDMSCLSLTIKSPQISLKTNPIRIPPG